MDKIRSLLGTRRMDRVPNARIRELCEMAKGVEERIEEDVLHWSSHVERMENDRIAKRLYIGEFADISSAGQPRKEEMDLSHEGLLKKKEKRERFGCQASKENGA